MDATATFDTFITTTYENPPTTVSTAAKPAQLPPKITPLKVPKLNNKLPLFLAETRFCLISPLQKEPASAAAAGGGPWLAKISDFEPDKWHLTNPFNMHNYFLSSNPVVGELNLWTCKIQELSRPLALISHGNDVVSKKIVGGVKSDSTYLFAVLAQLEVKHGGGLVFWKVGSQNWTQIEGTGRRECFDEGGIRVSDVAYYKGKFYAFDVKGWRIGVIDPENPSSKSKFDEFIVAPDILTDPIDDCFAVELEGEAYVVGEVNFVPTDYILYLVFTVIPKKAEAEEGVGGEPEAKPTVVVYMLNEKKGEWQRLASIGKQVFFIGYDVAFGLFFPEKCLPHWKPGTICLFTRPFPMIFDGRTNNGKYGAQLPEGTECLESISYAELWRYMRVFKTCEADKGIVPVKDMSREELEVYTGLFFPPPPWIKWLCPGRNNAEVKLHKLKYRSEEDEVLSLSVSKPDV